MDPTLEVALGFLVEHGYLVLFAWVFLDQLGLPLPGLVVLLAAGALAGEGWLGVAPCLAVATAACVPADLIWYRIGRWRGTDVLRFLCRLALEPDSCVRNTEETFARHGARSLLVAKFVPGLQTVAPPLAGLLGMSPLRFLLFDAAGALLWATAFIVPGYLLHDQLERLARAAASLGVSLLVLLVALLALYLLLKYAQRRRFLRSLQVARISPAELAARLAAGEDVEIVDLRHSIDFAAEPRTLPGARRIAVEDLEARHVEIPRDRDIVLYCR